MHVRLAQEADTPAMARVMVDTYMRAHKGQIPEEVWLKRREEWTYQVSEQAWARTLRDIADGSSPRECVYLAIDTPTGEAGDQIVGIVMGGPAEVGPWEHAGDIYALYVRFDRQRRGVGRHLLGAAANHLSQLGMTALIIRSLPANTPANRFYESLGGQIIGECEVEEYGYRILERIYGWADSSLLLDKRIEPT